MKGFTSKEDFVGYGQLADSASKVYDFGRLELNHLSDHAERITLIAEKINLLDGGEA